jgi:hypothetical protein
MTTTSDRFPVPAGIEDRVAQIRRERIDLSKEDTRRGRSIIADVTAALDGLSGRNGFPLLLPGEAFSAGSFGRKTQARPLDDIDLFIPLDAASLRMEDPSGRPTEESLVSRVNERSLGCDPTLGQAPWLASHLVLDRICPILCQHIALHPRSDCGKNRRGRCAHLTYSGINIDLVFVLWAKHRRLDRYLLPCGTSWRWKASNPKDDQQRVTAANIRNLGHLLPVIRILKAWNDHPGGGRLKSIHLEVLLVEHIYGAGQVTIGSPVSGVANALAALPDALRRSCPDPTGLGDDLDVNLDQEDRDWMIAKATNDAARFQHALTMGQDDPDAAAREIEAILLTKGPERPTRDRQDREPRHDGEQGQPAQRCDAALPPPAIHATDRPTQPANQTRRSGQYG